jgi:hypothetical protein
MQCKPPDNYIDRENMSNLIRNKFLGQLVLEKMPPDPDIYIDGLKQEDKAGIYSIGEGIHRILVKKDGRKDFVADNINVEYGKVTTVKVKSDLKPSLIPYILMGSGLTVAGVGGYYLYNAESIEDEYNKKSSEFYLTYAETKRYEDDANKSYNIGLFSSIIGAGLFTTGAILYFLEDNTAPEWRSK